MNPGEIVIDEIPERAVASFLADYDAEVRTLFESLAGGDGAAYAEAETRFKAAVAAMAAELGAADLTPTRKQGAIDPPEMIDASWVRLAVWRLETESLYVSISGAPGKAARVELTRDARKRAGAPHSWLQVVGVGLDGLDGLSPAARTLIEGAELIVGAERHLNMVIGAMAERLAWPSPFDAMIDALRARQGRRVVVLVTGDPLWYSAGAKLARAFAPAEIAFHPCLSAFQLAACRMRWSLADLETITIHGRAPEQILPWLAPGARIIAIGAADDTPARLGALLTANGYGPSRLTMLSRMGAPDESRVSGRASSWRGVVDPFHVIAVECLAEPGARVLPRAALPDDAFRHDGKMTKREIRALTVAALWPRRGALLWDVGAGCGSVAIEWMRAARDAEAIGLEPNAERRAMAAENALALGAARLDLVDASAPDGLAQLAPPDAVFLGGGLSDETIEVCLGRLKPQGRLVANAVTLESEALLAEAQARHGGELVKLSIARAEPVGGFRGWRPLMPVTQWSVSK